MYIAIHLAASAALALPQSPQPREPDGAEDPTRVALTGRFELRSHPWVNLHHFLYQWARADQGLGRGRGKVAVPERATLSELPEAERRAWVRALEFYRSSVAERSLFDESMLTSKRGLRELEGLVEAQPPDEIPGMAEALATAAPVYWTRWWPEHDAANRAWIEGVAPILRRNEERFVALTERIHGSSWPERPWLVDVSAYANQHAGYTADDHVVIFSTDPGIRGLYAAEIVFHEVQHTDAIGAPGRLGLAEAFEAAEIEAPRNLWHGLIFGTAGEFTRAFASEEGAPEHTPYWIREGFDEFVGWSEVVRLVGEHWLPVVRGEATRSEGLADLVRAAADR